MKRAKSNQPFTVLTRDKMADFGGLILANFEAFPRTAVRNFEQFPRPKNRV